MTVLRAICRQTVKLPEGIRSFNPILKPPSGLVLNIPQISKLWQIGRGVLALGLALVDLPRTKMIHPIKVMGPQFMNMSIIKPGILGRYLIFSGWDSYAPKHFFLTWNSGVYHLQLEPCHVQPLLHVEAAKKNKNKHMNLKFATHLGEAQATLYNYLYWSDSPRSLVSHLCSS